MSLPSSRCIIVATLAAAGALSACADAPTSPEDVWVAMETAPALRAAETLPTLPRVVERASEAEDSTADGSLRRARTLWAAGREVGGEAGALRDSAYAIAVPRLSAELDSAAFARMERELTDWLGIASSGAEELDVPWLDARVDRARRWIRGARASRAAGERTERLESLLRAADELSAITPRAVASRLIREATAARAAWPDASARSDDAGRRFRRADRLLAGARRALTREDHVRAIRRAYYAGQLFRRR